MKIFSKTKKSKNFFRLSFLTTSLLTLVVLFFILAMPAFALDTGLEFGRFTGLGSQDIRITIMKIIRIVLGFVGIIAILIILYGGFVWLTSGGNAEKVETAKRILRNAVIGLIIIFSAFAIVSFIISQLETALGIGGGGPGGPPSPCENCGHLGSGIIESVYPAPGARNVSRNTNIVVNFKVQMNATTIIDDTNGSTVFGDCTVDPVICDTLKANSVIIESD
ncbi:MAG TPA: TrbC/VirB2 family protein, partial [Patescibacteria group bacterium]|nr:TrbC/VirB2 family protein [Patescibacteria group bacterium]